MEVFRDILVLFQFGAVMNKAVFFKKEVILNKISNLQINVRILCLKTFNYIVIISELFRDILCQCAELDI